VTAPQFLQTAYGHTTRQIVQFGGLPVPGSNAVCPWVDLNDRVAWYAVGSPQIDNTHISNKSSQLAWRGRGVWLAQDFVGRKVRMAMHYDETSGVPFSQAKALLTQSGEQWLTFDQTTGLRVRTNSFAESTFLTGAPDAPGQYTHQVELEWLSRNPFMQDMNMITVGPFTLNTGNNYAAINYAGQAFGEPVLYCNLPAGNTAKVTQVVFGNNWGETVYMPIKGGTTSGAHTLLIGTDTLSCIMDNALIAPVGNFPYMYPGFPPPATTTLLVQITTANNAALAAGSTYYINYFNQWEI
jgi:hypothetical protein